MHGFYLFSAVGLAYRSCKKAIVSVYDAALACWVIWIFGEAAAGVPATGPADTGK
jgi:hypothetical protein|tara:strand:+ start:260 stop:424 length:165 start_codon:yes stop_codon:yes gene_type:complete